VKYFLLREFRCRCQRGIACDAMPMKVPFLLKLDALREDWGKPLSPTSARRCKLRNTSKEVEGAVKSQHLLGNACDFVFSGPEEARTFALLAEKHGFAGIGLGNRLVHIDDRATRARWIYND